MKPEPFHCTLAYCLARRGQTDTAFSAAAGIGKTTLSGWKIGRNYPPVAGLEKLLAAFAPAPALHRRLLHSYLINSFPPSYQLAVAALLDSEPLVMSEAAEGSSPTSQDPELDAALARLAAIAPKRKHVRDLLDIIGKSPLRAWSSAT